MSDLAAGPDPAARPPRATRRIGHKGADHIAPGNTLASFDAALAHDVDMIEFDVLPEHMDGTGRLLLAHDYADAARRTPLTLEEGLAHFASAAFAGVELDLDLKLPGYEERVVAALREHGLASRTLVSTMEPVSFPRIRAMAPEVRLGWAARSDIRDTSMSAGCRPTARAAGCAPHTAGRACRRSRR